MRYFVVDPPEDDLPMRVVAEVAPVLDLETERGAEYSSGDGFARDLRTYFTGGEVYREDELPALHGGKLALATWRARDDSAYLAWQRREHADALSGAEAEERRSRFEVIDRGEQ